SRRRARGVCRSRSTCRTQNASPPGGLASPGGGAPPGAGRGARGARPPPRLCLSGPPLASFDAMEVEHAIRTRRTHKAYTSEPVDRETLEELFELARWAPNHNLTNPWRFRVVGPHALERLKEAAGPESAAKLARAPTLVVCSCALSGDPVQDEEDLHATACAAYIVLLGAHA